MTKFNYLQMIKGPTRITRQTKTLIDMAFTNKPERITRTYNLTQTWFWQLENWLESGYSVLANLVVINQHLSFLKLKLLWGWLMNPIADSRWCAKGLFVTNRKNKTNEGAKQGRVEHTRLRLETKTGTKLQHEQTLLK